MKTKETLVKINDELGSTLEALSETQLEALERAVTAADRIFVAGAGRSLMMIRGFAMRMMHMGYASYVVGETVTPAIRPGDLLLIASGSGSTGTLTVMAEKAKSAGATLALITTLPDSPIGKMANVIVEVKAATPKSSKQEIHSIQPGATTFEQCVLLIGDAIVIDLISGKSIDEINAMLMERHANLE